jgi:hypothetical protein
MIAFSDGVTSSATLTGEETKTEQPEWPALMGVHDQDRRKPNGELFSTFEEAW